MDNTAQTNQSNIQESSNIQPSQSSKTQQPVPQQPATPVASSNKELEKSSAFSEIVKPSEEEVKVEEELKNVGVVVNSDKPKLDKVHEQIGVKASAESVSVSTSPPANITLPLSEEEADSVLKTKQSKFHLQENVGEFAGEYTEDSLPFLAALVVKVFKEMHKKIFRRKK